MIVFPDTLPPLNRKIVETMQLRFPIIEDPLGSNTSPEIARMAKRWGIPTGLPWCALLTTDVWFDAGAQVPPKLGGATKTGRERHPAVADWWREWALREGLFSPLPVIGAAALYGFEGREPAVHIGVCVATVHPRLMNFEGNTTGKPFDREGTMTQLKDVNGERLIGYVLPRLRP
jgi:hypothetical protein